MGADLDGPRFTIGLDATYSLGRNLSGVGNYSRELIFGLARAHPERRFDLYYRPHRFLKALRDEKPANATRRLLRGVPHVELFHALNQRVDFPAKRTVTTFHDLFVMTGDYSSAEFRAKFTGLARRAAERSDRIIAVSRFTARQVMELLGVEESRISVIPHGVRIPDGREQSAAREKLVLSVGAIQRRKNVRRLVRAFERMPAEWRLKLIGAVDGYGASEELKAVENSPASTRIDVLGYVSASELRSLYERAGIFAFPSLDEGFGMPVLEAMAHGIPVITSNRSALPEVAGGAALLVDPESTDEIADALLRLAGDETLQAELCRKGLARAKEFSWDAAIERTWQVYCSLMSCSLMPV